jgi:hypothetical protein
VTDWWTVVLAFVSVLVLTCGLLVFAWRRGRLGVASALLFVLAVAAWAAGFAAIASDFHDADGFADCRDDCTVMHRVAVLGFVAPPLLISVAAGGMVLAIVARGRRRRASA